MMKRIFIIWMLLMSIIAVNGAEEQMFLNGTWIDTHTTDPSISSREFQASMRMYPTLWLHNETITLNGIIDLYYGSGNKTNWDNSIYDINYLQFYLPDGRPNNNYTGSLESGYYSNVTASCGYYDLMQMWVINTYRRDGVRSLVLNGVKSAPSMAIGDWAKMYQMLKEDNASLIMAYGSTTDPFVTSLLVYNASSHSLPGNNGTVVYPCGTSPTYAGAGYFPVSYENNTWVEDGNHTEFPKWSYYGTEYYDNETVEANATEDADFDIDIHVRLHQGSSTVEPDTYKAYLFDCPDPSYYNDPVYETLINNCDRITGVTDPTINLNNGSYWWLDVTEDRDLLLYVYRNKYYQDFHITLNPSSYDPEEIVEHNFSISTGDFNYTISFVSSDTQETLLDVEYEFYDATPFRGRPLLDSGSSTDPIIFSYIFGEIMLDLSATKPNYEPYVIDDSDSKYGEILAFNHYRINMIPTNKSLVDVSGYVLYSPGDEGMGGIQIDAYCGDRSLGINVLVEGSKKTVYSGADGFYNVSSIEVNSFCIFDVDDPIYRQNDLKISVENVSLYDQNITLFSRDEDTYIIYVRNEIRDEVFRGIKGMSIQAVSQCGYAHNPKGQTDENGQWFFYTPYSNCTYEIITNSDLAQSIGSKVITTVPGQYIYEINYFQDETDEMSTDETINCGSSYANKTAEIINVDTGEVWTTIDLDENGIGIFQSKGGLRWKSDCDRDSSGGGSEKIYRTPDNPEATQPPRVVTPDTPETDALDTLWTTVLNASRFFEFMLIIFILLMFVKIVKAFMMEVGH